MRTASAFAATHSLQIARPKVRMAHPTFATDQTNGAFKFSLAQLKNILFICGKNKWRSPTAEHIFAEHPGIACLSAGTSHDAEVEVSVELIEWADLIFVMEKEHKSKLSARFAEHLAGKRIVCLNIPDRYPYMDASLIKLLQRKVLPYLG
jgi:predicted protein tyrosine phosphatase